MGLTHKRLCEVGRLFGYPELDEGGLCRGLTVALNWAIGVDQVSDNPEARREEKRFYRRLELLASYNTGPTVKDSFRPLLEKIETIRTALRDKTRCYQELTEDEWDLLEIPAFFETVLGYLSPRTLPVLFGGKYVNQYEQQTIFPLFHPDKLEHHRAVTLFSRDYLFDREALRDWLEDLKTILSETAMPVPVLLENDSHAVSLTYHRQKQCWVYTDVNDFERYPDEKNYYRELNTTELAKSLFVSFSDTYYPYTLMTAEVTVASPDDKMRAVHEQQAALQKKLDASLNGKKYSLKKEEINLCNSNGAGLLHQACCYGRPGAVIQLLDAGADINQATIRDGVTPLFMAGQEGHIEVVKALLKKGVNVNQARKTDGVTLLLIACENGHIEVAKALLANPRIQVNKAKKSGATPLFMACQNGHAEVVKLLLIHPEIDINQAKITEGATPFYMACQNGHIGVVKVFLANPRIKVKIKVNKAMKNGATPFYMACYNGHTEVVKALLANLRIKVNKADKNGVTPFYMACYNGHTEVVKALLANPRIKVNKAQKNDTTPLYAACQEGHEIIVSILVRSGKLACMNKVGIAGHTPLLVACLSPATRGKNRLFQLLLKNGADMMHTNDEGQTALDIAFCNLDGVTNEAAVLELLEHARHKNLPLKHIMSAETLEKAIQWAKDKNNRLLQHYLFLEPFKRAYRSGYGPSIFDDNPYQFKTVAEVEGHARRHPCSRTAQVWAKMNNGG